MTQGASSGGVAGSLMDEDFFSSGMGTAKPKKVDDKPDPNEVGVYAFCDL